MKNPLSQKLKSFPFIPTAIVFCVLYWLYLALITEIILIWDSIDYENLGSLVFHKGWLEFFKTGPNREPLYPAIVALAMKISAGTSLSYQFVLKIIQLFLLFLTQMLTLKLLKKLKISNWLIALTLLYLGISPALVNIALSLYSEVAAFPFIPAIILLSSLVWQDILARRKRIFVTGALLGLAFLLVTFVKGMFEIIAPVFLLPFILFAIRTFPRRESRPEKRLFNAPLAFLLTFCVFFYVPLFSYKFANKVYNGNFVLTNRGAFAIYGNTARRMERLMPKHLGAALAFVPGEDICRTFFDNEACVFWSHRRSDDLGYEKVTEFTQQGLANALVDKKLIQLSAQEILKNPFQYAFLAGVESLKMIFWESTEIGFVVYPDWLTALFKSTLFKRTLRFVVALLTLLAIIYSTGFLWARRKNIFDGGKKPDESFLILFSILMLLVPFIGLHAFFFVLTRYILPVASLYLVVIAFFLSRIRHPHSIR